MPVAEARQTRKPRPGFRLSRNSESLPVVQSGRRLPGLLPGEREDPTEKLAFGYMTSRPFAYLVVGALSPTVRAPGLKYPC